MKTAIESELYLVYSFFSVDMKTLNSVSVNKWSLGYQTELQNQILYDCFKIHSQTI